MPCWVGVLECVCRSAARSSTKSIDDTKVMKVADCSAGRDAGIAWRKMRTQETWNLREPVEPWNTWLEAPPK
jgi:hypothetical protein